MQFKQCGAAKPHLHNTDARCYLSIDSLTHHTFDLAQVSRYPISQGGGLGLGIVLLQETFNTSTLKIKSAFGGMPIEETPCLP